MMNEPLFGTPLPPRVYLSSLVQTLSYDQDEILRGIMYLHNNAQPFEADITYSRGVMWRNFPEPKYKFDLLPQAPGTIQANATNLPLPDESLNSIMFDPPFTAGVPLSKETMGIIKARFSCFKTISDLWWFYEGVLIEAHRVLKPGGILVVKCMDTVSNTRQYMSHYKIMGYAEWIEFYCKDLFILGAKTAPVPQNMKQQHHARKMHCYFLVFEK